MIAEGQVWWRLVPFHTVPASYDNDWVMGPEHTGCEGNIEQVDGWGVAVLEVLELLNSRELGKLALIRKTFTDPDGNTLSGRKGQRIVRTAGGVRSFLNAPKRKWTLRA